MRNVAVKYKGCVLLPHSIFGRCEQDRKSILHLAFNELQSAIGQRRRDDPVNVENADYYRSYIGAVRNTSGDFHGISSLIINDEVVKIVQQQSDNVLSKHPIHKVSLFHRVNDRPFICYVAKDQEPGFGSIGNDRACFFVKLLDEAAIDEVIGKFKHQFGMISDSNSMGLRESSNAPSTSSGTTSQDVGNQYALSERGDYADFTNDETGFSNPSFEPYITLHGDILPDTTSEHNPDKAVYILTKSNHPSFS